MNAQTKAKQADQSAPIDNGPSTTQAPTAAPANDPTAPASVAPVETLDTVITYGDFRLDVADPATPRKAVMVLCRRGFSHILGNEAASKAMGALMKQLGEANPTSDEDALKVLYKALPDETYDAAKLAAQRELFDALMNGTLGASSRGPSKDPFEAAKDRIAWEEIVLVIKGANLKVPVKSTDTVKMGGQTYTKDALVARRLANPDHGPRIEAEATKFVAAAKAKSDAAKLAAKSRTNEGVVDAAALGL